MEFYCSCSCACKFLARYTTAAVITPQQSTLSRQEQALEFCNVCASEFASEAVQSTSSAEWSWQAFQSHPFFKDLFLLAVGCPFMFFVCLIPLWFRHGAIFEVGSTYYWFWMFLPSGWFGRNLMVLSWGRGPQVRTVVMSALVASICCTVLHIVSCKTAMLRLGISVIAVFVQLYWPALHILSVRNEAHYDNTNFVLYLIGLCAGAVPCGMSGFLYYFVMKGFQNRQLTLLLCLAMWVCSAGLIKSMGKRIWAHAAPTCKMFGTVLWVFFVEVAMNCLGIRIFFSSVWSALLFFTSFLTFAALQLIRGTQKYYARLPTLETIGVHRLSILMETFASCVGRLAALTMYVSFASLQLATGKQTETIGSTMPSLLVTRMEILNAIDVYRNSNVDPSKPWLGIIGMIIVVFAFAMFTKLASRWWTTSSSAFEVHVVPVESEAHQLPAASSKNCADGGKAPALKDSVGFATVRDAATHRSQRWWDELYPGDLKINQFDLLSAFVAQYWSHLLSNVSFVLALSSLMADAVHWFLFEFLDTLVC